MEDRSRPSFPGVGGEKKLQIVSGINSNNHNNNNNCGYQNYARSWSRSSADSPPHYPAEETRPNDQLGAAAAPKPWRFQDPDTTRRKRIAKYKGYGIEGRVKASIRNGVGWIKNKCSQIIHGY